jgi:hypothetical protein
VAFSHAALGAETGLIVRRPGAAWISTSVGDANLLQQLFGQAQALRIAELHELGPHDICETLVITS